MVKKSGRDKPGQPRGWRPEEADRRRPKPPEGAAPRPRRVARAETGTVPDRAAAGETEALTILHGRQVLYGFHTVAAALANPRRKVHRVFATSNAAHRLSEMAPGALPLPMAVRAEALDRLLGAEVVHQGVAAEVEPLVAPDIHDLPAEGLILVLDQVTDPHNVGAILRSAAAFGVRALVVTERHSPEFTGVLAKTSSGGLEHVPIIAVGNLAQALTLLGERGFWRVGLDSDGDMPLETAVASAPVALVLGAEGKGLRRLTRERCDVLARLDVPGAVKSLNVSNAAAVALYAIGRTLSVPSAQ